MLAGERVSQFFQNWFYPNAAVLVFCIFLLIGVWGGTYWQIESDEKITIANIERNGEQYKRSLEEHVRRVLDNSSLYLGFIKTEYEDSRTVTLSMYNFISSLGQDLMINQVALVNTDGKTIASLFPYPDDFSSKETPYFEAHELSDNREIYIGRPFIGRVTRKISIPLSVRLNNPDGSFAGIVYIALNPNYFSYFYQSVGNSSYYEFAIIGKDKIVRASSKTGLIGSEMEPNLLSGAGIKKQFGIFTVAPDPAGEGWRSFRVMSSYPLVVQVEINASILRPLYERRQAMVGAAAAFSMFIIIYTGRLVLRTRRLRQREAELKASYRQMETTHRQLSATEEELRTQYESLLQVNEQVLEQNALLSALQDTSLSMMTELNTEQLLKKIAHYAVNIVGVDEAYVARPTEDGYIEVFGGIGGPPRMPAHIGLMGRVYSSGQAIVINDYQNWEGRIREEHAKKISALFAAPIKVKQEIVGIFGVAFFEAGRRFSDVQVSLFERFTDLVSLAMQNAMLHDTLQGELSARINSETTLNEIFNGTNDAIFVIDLENDAICWANQNASEMLGYSEEEIKLLGIAAIVPQEELAIIESNFKKVTGDKALLFEGKVIDRAGKPMLLEFSAKQTVVHGRTCCLAVARDITARKQLEAELALAQSEKLALLDSIPDAIFVLDYDGVVLEYKKSPDFETYFSLKEGMCRHHITEFIPKEIGNNYMFYVRKALATGVMQYYEYSVSMGDMIFFRETRFKKINDSWVLTMVRDITDAQRSKDQIEYLSMHDALTNLYNRAYFETSMNRMTQSDSGVAIMICDVDGLKIINDTLGHWAGDEVLRAVADILRTVTVFGDDVLARVGGDEFAIIVQEPKKEKMDAMVEAIQARIGKYNTLNPQLPVSLSVGWAADYNSNSNIAEIYKQADHDMYRQKIHQRQSSRSAIVQTMMKALEARDYITEGHTDRIQGWVEAMGRKLNFSRRQLADLRLFARFHDIGKVGIPDSILNKPSRLTEEEQAIMRRHCEIGFRIAQASVDLAPIADWILKHQEWWNGEGYPLGISREGIPLACRILAIADTYDAMTNDRPYRKAVAPSSALEEIERCAGTQFDPELAKLFIKIMQERELHNKSL